MWFLKEITHWPILSIGLIWLFTINGWGQNIQDNESKYHIDVIGLSNEGVLKGREKIQNFLQSLSSSHGNFVGFETKYKAQVNSMLEYEIRSSRTDNDIQFSHIIILSKENDSEQIICEVIYEQSNDAIQVPEELAEARQKWVEFCNKKNAKTLVSNLYTEDAIYYNRGRVLIGHADLTNEYSYMENPSYSLQLTPEHIEMVTDAIIYEIGMCSGSYNLPYILVWKKQPDMNWKIYFDSNY